ncbi:MAG: polysaccharide biosynthesis protein [Oscillospiraceae bacterium]|jgi:FlaA1/EpsC-like NDP-sugar epimerase|nr:polysaccharide biosynthesis protein [Oscillospiraceae bacterium]
MLKTRKVTNELSSILTVIIPKLVFIAVDAGCAAAAICLAYFFNLGSLIPDISVTLFTQYMLVLLFFTDGLLLIFSCFETNVIRFTIWDAIKTAIIIIAGFTLILVLNSIVRTPAPSDVVLNLFFIFSVLFAGVRLIVRAGSWIRGRFVYPLRDKGEAKNVLIVGAGDAGRYLANSLMYQFENYDRCSVVGFIDDNDELWGRTISGHRVFGGRESIPNIVRRHAVKEIIIAIPYVDNSTIRDIFSYCEATDCMIKRFANLSSFTQKSLSKSTIGDIKLEDLLGRTEQRLNLNTVSELVRGKSVLVTGGAGSIGSELCRQIMSYSPEELIVFDFNENGLYETGNELRESFPSGRFTTVLGSVRDVRRLREVFDEYRPDIVFHAAAHKHVPMMEINPFEAFTNNAMGTYNTAMVAEEYNVGRFILISTDKAVNPTNVMGASKRVAEMIIQYMNTRGGTIFSAVRFGNVLGSNGSVIPLFRKQIEKGGPLTVTDRNIKRYFMTIQEAVSLVLETSTMARGSEIFVLNMGEPVYIYDLACTMVRLSGLIPERDIKIEVVGLRDGEKLFEELSLSDENLTKTENDSVFILRSCACVSENFDYVVKQLFKAVVNRNSGDMKQIVTQLVPSYRAITMNDLY